MHPARGVWVEICLLLPASTSEAVVPPRGVHGLKLQEAQNWKVASYGMHGLKRTYLLLFIIKIRKVCSQLIWLQIFFCNFSKISQNLLTIF